MMGADGRDGAVEGVGCADARETVNVCDCGARARLLRAVVRCGTRLSLVCVYSENLCFGIHVLYVGSHLKWNTLNTYSPSRLQVQGYSPFRAATPRGGCHAGYTSVAVPIQYNSQLDPAGCQCDTWRWPPVLTRGPADARAALRTPRAPARPLLPSPTRVGRVL